MRDARTHPAPPLSIASGPDLVLPPDSPGTVVGAVARRVAESPDGMLRSWRLDGRHVCQSYAQLWQRSAAVAANLCAMGAGPRRTVVLLIEEQIAFAVAFLACLRIGVTIVPLVGTLRASASGTGGFAYALGLFDDPLIVADETLSDLARRVCGSSLPRCVDLATLEAAAEFADVAFVEPDPVLMLPTSGSTGRPKLVALDPGAALYRRFAANTGTDLNVRHSLGIFPVDSTSNIDSVFLRHRSWTHVAPEIVAQRPQAILEAVEEFGVTALALPSSTAATLVTICENGGFAVDLSSLTHVGIGGETVVRSFIEKLDREIVRLGGRPRCIRAGYGTTETGSLLTGSNPLDTAPGRAVQLGSCLPGVAIRVVGDDGGVVAEGQIGEIQIDTPRKIFKCYWGDEEATRNAFTPDGWWRTGDLGSMQGGRMTLHGRAKEILIVKGRKFSLADIDMLLGSVLGDHDRAYCCAVHFENQATEELAIAFVTSARDEKDRDALVRDMRDAVIRRFGLMPRHVRRVEADQIPRNASGKLKRDELPALFATAGGPQPGRARTDEAFTERLADIWRTALDLGHFDAEADFFDLGGDSLRALALHDRILDAFGIHISAEEFFAAPNFAALSRLVAASRGAPEAPAQSDWPLPPRLHHRLLTLLETWPGERPTRSRMVLAHNDAGSKPPLFWVFNAEPEPGLLAAALGEDQPLYAFRSGAEISDYDENDIQAFALRYLSEIEQISPGGPLLIGGNCQGALIALAIAQHALRRRRHVPLLVLADWMFELQPYRGRVLMFAGRDDRLHNPRRRYQRPELGLGRAFPNHEFVETSGSFVFDAGAMPEVAAELRRHLGESIAAPVDALPSEGYVATIATSDAPAQMESGARTTLDVTVGNGGPLRWLPSARSGLTLASRWSDAEDDLIADFEPRADLPEIGPQQSATVRLPIVAPAMAGEFRLHVDVCSEGSRWFNRDPRRAFTVPVVVTPTPPRRVQSILHAVRRSLVRREERYAFAAGASGVPFLTFGWSAPENWGAWNVGVRAKLRLPGRSKYGRWRVALAVTVFGREGESRPVHVRVGEGGPELAWSFVANTVAQQHLDVRFAGDDVVVRFAVPDAVSPFALGKSADHRRLGLGLVEMRMNYVGA